MKEKTREGEVYAQKRGKQKNVNVLSGEGEGEAERVEM